MNTFNAKPSEANTKVSEKETSKPKRKISSQPLDLINGKTNLAFVPEESEDDLQNEGESKNINNHNAIKNDVNEAECYNGKGGSTDNNKNSVDNNIKDTVEKDAPPFELNSILKTNTRRHTSHSIDIRRCSGRSDITLPENNKKNRGSVNSVEVRRHSRTFKRFSRAFSQLSFHPQLNQNEYVCELKGMEMEVRKKNLFGDFYVGFVNMLHSIAWPHTRFKLSSTEKSQHFLDFYRSRNSIRHKNYYMCTNPFS